MDQETKTHLELVLWRIGTGMATIYDAEFLEELITQLQQDIFDLTMVIEGEIANEQQSISAGVFGGVRPSEMADAG